MAKQKTAAGGTDKAKKKKNKAVVADVGGTRIKVKVAKAKGANKARGADKAKADSSGGGFEALARLADHPIVADLIAIGATAAVAAIAERGLKGGKTPSGSGAAKAAGKAAAAAIGRRLMSELNTVKDAAVDAAKKA